MCLNVNGRQIRRSTGSTKKDLARKILFKAQTLITEGQWFETHRSKTIRFKEMVERYMSSHAKSRDPHTIKKLLPAFGELRLAEITTDLVADYRNERLKKVKPATVYQELGLMRRMFNVARREWKWVKDNPVADLSFSVGTRNFRDRWLTEEEEYTLLRNAGNPWWLYPLLMVALHTGMRKGEILALRWQDIDFRRRILTIHKSKTNMKRGIPLSDTLTSVLLDLKQNRKLFEISGRVFPISDRSLRQSYNKALERSGIENFTFHDLRHTFATRLVQNGVDIYSVQKLLGHTTVSMTLRYTHHYPESLRGSIAVLDKSITNLSQSRPDGLTTSQKML